jgi:hypothetical protein
MLMPEELYAIATKTVDDFASNYALEKLLEKPQGQQDDVLAQALLWNKDILEYLALSDAIKSGDIGMIKDLLPRLLFRFIGGTNAKYALEILELM